MISLLVLMIAVHTSVSLAQPARPGCAGPEFRQFDFWIGEWDVHAPQGRLLGRNRITSILGGCALREEWTSADGTTVGTSHNAYDPLDRRWHQDWVDNGPTRLTLVGGLAGREMVLEQRVPSGSPALAQAQRITWTPLADGRVRQHWQVSKDGGTTWATAFDGFYTKRGAAPAPHRPQR